VRETLAEDYPTGEGLDSHPPAGPDLPVTARPFLKWAGGKAWLVPVVKKLIGIPVGNYYEPFLGAGAIFLALDPSIKKTGSDLNVELINTWIQVRDNLDNVVSVLRDFKNNEDFFKTVRSWDRKEGGLERRDPAERAARMIFLNKTCFNGLYRVNSKGEFNVPYGRNPRANFADVHSLEKVREALQMNLQIHASNSQLAVSDYKSAADSAGHGDVIYFDPPYEPLNPTSSFVSYQRSGFSRDDQEALRDVAVSAMARGARVIVSNSTADFIGEIYSEDLGFQKQVVTASRAISASANGRQKVREFLITGGI
jgi:DNA adenine methylase